MFTRQTYRFASSWIVNIIHMASSYFIVFNFVEKASCSAKISEFILFISCNNNENMSVHVVPHVDVVPRSFVGDLLGEPSLFGRFSLDCSAMWPTAQLALRGRAQNESTNMMAFDPVR